MNSKELQLIIKCGETSTVQFKECFPNQDSIAAEMVAMSNARGGMILFGIKDKTGEIIGLSYQEIQQLNSILANIATNLLRPVIYIQTETVIVDERSLLIAHIAEGDNKPYKDLNGIIWTKQGADKRKVMENSEIMRLFQCSGILYADEQPIPFTSEKISTDMLWTTLSAKNMVAKRFIRYSIHRTFTQPSYHERGQNDFGRPAVLRQRPSAVPSNFCHQSCFFFW